MPLHETRYSVSTCAPNVGKHWGETLGFIIGTRGGWVGVWGGRPFPRSRHRGSLSEKDHRSVNYWDAIKSWRHNISVTPPKCTPLCVGACSDVWSGVAITRATTQQLHGWSALATATERVRLPRPLRLRSTRLRRRRHRQQSDAVPRLLGAHQPRRPRQSLPEQERHAASN